MKTILPMLLVAACLCGCAPDHVPAAPLPPAPEANARLPETPPPEAIHAGWYMQRSDASETFHPCGEDATWLVGSAGLRDEAKAFGLAPDTPVYVRVRGKLDGRMLAVASVEQFGSSTPVTDCAMGDGARVQ